MKFGERLLTILICVPLFLYTLFYVLMLIACTGREVWTLILKLKAEGRGGE